MLGLGTVVVAGGIAVAYWGIDTITSNLTSGDFFASTDSSTDSGKDKDSDKAVDPDKDKAVDPNKDKTVDPNKDKTVDPNKDKTVDPNKDKKIERPPAAGGRSGSVEGPSIGHRRGDFTNDHKYAVTAAGGLEKVDDRVILAPGHCLSLLERRGRLLGENPTTC